MAPGWVRARRTASRNGFEDEVEDTKRRPRSRVTARRPKSQAARIIEGESIGVKNLLANGMDWKSIGVGVERSKEQLTQGAFYPT